MVNNKLFEKIVSYLIAGTRKIILKIISLQNNTKKINKTLAKIYFKLTYFQIHKRKLNIEKPIIFDEKLIYIYLKYYIDNPLVSECTDKYLAREFVKQQGLKNILNENFGVYNSVSEIPWNDLPNQFVLKCTHGCGYNIVCKDKNTLDVAKCETMLNNWMQEKHGDKYCELHYNNITPRIICEKYLNFENEHSQISEYRFFCFNGIPKIITVTTKTELESYGFRNNFDIKWNDIGIDNIQCKNPTPIKKLVCLDEMIEYCIILSKPFPFVRIDFGICNNKPIFGELTFTPGGCFLPHFNDHGRKMLGDMLYIE